MHFLSQILPAVVAAFIGQAAALPLIVHPGTANDIVITKNNTINGTDRAIPIAPQATEQLQFSFVNNLNGGAVNAYVTGLDDNNQLVMLQPDGTWYYPTADTSGVPQPITGNVAIPLGGQGSTTQITLPSYISSGRVWFAEGTLQFFTVQGASGPSLVEPSAVNPSDPSAAVNWGFVELTNNSGGLFANISYVDFVGLVLGMILNTASGATQSAQGLQPGAVASICSDLASRASQDGQPWDQLCVKDTSGTPLRVLAPSDYISINPNAFSGYYSDYTNQVWSTYSTSTLTIDTQAGAGEVACTVTDGTLNCAGDNRGYAMPNEGDIFGCNSGPFAIIAGDNDVHAAVVPRLCAAFDRTTLLLPGGNVQPSLDSSNYYTTDPTNWYSATVHKYEIDGKGYAFSYDDVNPAGENQSGVVSDADPTLLTITIGGPSS